MLAVSVMAMGGVPTASAFSLGFAAAPAAGRPLLAVDSAAAGSRLCSISATAASNPPALFADTGDSPALNADGAGKEQSAAYEAVDWSFLDAAFLITCPSTDGSNPRLQKAMTQLQAVGLSDRTEVREFATDDEDRIRGCYTSHITVLEEAAARFATRPEIGRASCRERV